MGNFERENWIFEYKVADVLEGAITRRDYHEGRLKWWSEQYEEVRKKILAEGITFDQSLLDRNDFAKSMFSNSMPSYARGQEVTVDPELLRDLQECATKKIEHMKAFMNYSSWCAALQHRVTNSPEALLPLKFDDWRFFFLVPMKEEEED